MLQGTVTSLDLERKVVSFAAMDAQKTTEEVPYDYFVAASGLRRA